MKVTSKKVRNAYLDGDPRPEPGDGVKAEAIAVRAIADLAKLSAYYADMGDEDRMKSIHRVLRAVVAIVDGPLDLMMDWEATDRRYFDASG